MLPYLMESWVGGWVGELLATVVKEMKNVEMGVAAEPIGQVERGRKEMRKIDKKGRKGEKRGNHLRDGKLKTISGPIISMDKTGSQAVGSGHLQPRIIMGRSFTQARASTANSSCQI